MPEPTISRSPSNCRPLATGCKSGASALLSMNHPSRYLGKSRNLSGACRRWKICPDRNARPCFPPQARHLVVAVACQGEQQRDYDGFSHYSTRDLARLLAGRGEIVTISPATVQRILAEMVLQPHR